ncbi:putative phage tail protein [Acetanaerobacterium elongatum]|uniref:DUF2313 domain-containing protein n=1 Tax=Acetanaerobacterium elongatum TaxID=258515 RepID=A0A1G9Z2J1_9FIRM|nr:putative phage tail protein [Acetanaerobacterium elongatum]SDN15549.1 hypothetical protein SAMN05192585_11270 [Acetanaerobacterium elongatum]
MFYDLKPEYKAHLPPYYENIAEISVLDTVIIEQLEKIQSRIRLLAESRFVELTNVDGVKRWESILALNSPIKSTLQSRKNAVKAKLMSKPPITIETLRAVIETYLGVPVNMVTWTLPDIPNWYVFGKATWGDVEKTFWRDYLPTGTPYTIDVYYRGFEKLPDLDPLYATINELIPANIVVNIHYAYATWREAQVQYPTWQQICEHTWNHIMLGAWLNA